jgi:hypothetical protein
MRLERDILWHSSRWLAAWLLGVGSAGCGRINVKLLQERDGAANFDTPDSNFDTPDSGFVSLDASIDAQGVASLDGALDGADGASLGDSSPRPSDDAGACVSSSYVADNRCGIGYCRQFNTPSRCVDGLELPCVAGAPRSSTDQTPDGVDDDCDGQVDEDVSCGAGPMQWGVGSHSFSVPLGCSTITVQLWGAGGAGGENAYFGVPGATAGSGGGGGYVRVTLRVTASSNVQLIVGGGAGGCSSGGLSDDARYSGGAPGAAGADGQPGLDAEVAGGGTGGSSGGTGARGGTGHFGGGGGGGGDNATICVAPYADTRGGGGGAGSAVSLDGLVVGFAGGGGGGGGAGIQGGFTCVAGPLGGQGGGGCGQDGSNGTGPEGGGGGGGGMCMGDVTVAATGATPADPLGLLPASTASGGTASCVAGRNGYAVVTFAR